MKTKNFLSISAIVIALLTTSILFAQGNSFAPIVNDSDLKHVYAYLENAAGISYTAEASSNSENVAVSAKLTKSFSKLFGKNTEQNWTLCGDNLLNRFTYKGMPTRSLFTTSGQLIYSISYARESDMPITVANVLKNDYPGYAITTPIQVKQNGIDVWVAYMVNTKKIFTVRVENDVTEEVSEMANLK